MANTKFPTWEEYLQLTDEEIERLEYWTNIDTHSSQAASQEEYDSNEEYYEQNLIIT